MEWLDNLLQGLGAGIGLKGGTPRQQQQYKPTYTGRTDLGGILSQGQGPLNVGPSTQVDQFGILGGLPGAQTRYTQRTPKAKQGGVSSQVSSIDARLSEIDKLLASLQGAQAPVWIPNFDITGAYDRARKTAIQNVSPKFAEDLRIFREENARLRGVATGAAETAKTRAEEDLATLLEGSGIQRGRTTEDVSRELTGITAEEEARQEQEGRLFDQERRQTQSALAEAGFTGRGAGGQELENLEQLRKETEEKQQRLVDNEKFLQEQFKTRTFEDLSRKDTLSKRDRDRILEDADTLKTNTLDKLAYDLLTGERSIEMDKQRSIMDQTSGEVGKLYRDYLSGLKGSGQVQRASEVYGYLNR